MRAAIFSRASMPNASRRWSASRQTSCRTTSRPRRRGFCAACTTRCYGRRRSSSGSCTGKFSTWPSTSASPRQPAAGIRVCACPRRISASSGSRWDLPTASTCCQRPPSCCTRLRTTVRPKASARFSGMTRNSPLIGRCRPAPARRCPTKTSSAVVSRRGRV